MPRTCVTGTFGWRRRIPASASNPLLGGLDALRHFLLLCGFRRLGTGHFAELAPDARFIVRMNFLEVSKLALGDVMRNAPHGFRHVEEEPRLLAGVEQVEERGDLLVVVIAVAVIVALSVAHDFQGRLGITLVL